MSALTDEAQQPGMHKKRRFDKTEGEVFLSQLCSSPPSPPPLSSCGGAAEDTGDEGGGGQLVFVGHLVQLFSELRQRLPHPPALVLGAGGEERPRGVPRLAGGVPGLQRAAVSR